MAQQRLHNITSARLTKLKESINAAREAEGCKKLTTPDLIEEIVSMFETSRNIEIKKLHKRECK